jgi:hypothetical protein
MRSTLTSREGPRNNFEQGLRPELGDRVKH